MDHIKYLIEDWALVVAAGALIAVCIWCVIQFFKQPKSKQIAKVQEWLLWAVTKAEAELGSGTGQLKLRYVYDMFVEKFPAVAKMITFDFFSMMVDRALDKMKEILNQNKAAAKLVEIGEKTLASDKNKQEKPERTDGETEEEDVEEAETEE